MKDSHANMSFSDAESQFKLKRITTALYHKIKSDATNSKIKKPLQILFTGTKIGFIHFLILQKSYLNKTSTSS